MKYRSSPLLSTLAIALAVTLPAAVGQSNSSNQPPRSPQGQAENSIPADGSGSESASQTSALSQRSQERISREVRHQLVLLPFYSVFDNLAYQVSPEGTVTLIGQVVKPTLKSDAENVVKHIEGVEKVVNNIQVLPVSPDDDRIRRATYRAIYSNEVLSQYELRAVPPIHIIVSNGHVTLEGVVARQMDKQIAEMQAKGVPGVFSVTDNLRVEKQ
ncbi:MAG: transport-associated protein [Acidobacteria bacterium]|nr:MAG: transport-associated protein [Acidobacteriota bacterium]PYY09189.1 MAG: transport-associated protein [Acidobacteriota bacterium]